MQSERINSSHRVEGMPPTREFKIESYCILALGIALLVGGLFLILASHQVLPHGVNVISRLGFVGLSLSYGTLALGLLVAASQLSTHLCSKSHTDETPIIDEIPRAPKNKSADAPFFDAFASLNLDLSADSIIEREIREGGHYIQFLRLKSNERCDLIRKMKDKEFYTYCKFLFLDPKGKKLVEENDLYLAELRCNPIWEFLARYYNAPESWIKAVKRAYPFLELENPSI